MSHQKIKQIPQKDDHPLSCHVRIKAQIQDKYTYFKLNSVANLVGLGWVQSFPENKEEKISTLKGRV